MLKNVSSRKGLSLIVIIAISIALAIYFVQGITSNTSATNKEILNLASDTNLDVDAVFTSDGNTALLPTTSHLYIIDILSGNILKLINLASDTMPGVDVVFTADNMIAVLPTTSHLYMIEIPSGGIKELINLASDTNTDVDVVITPDGNTALLPTTSHLYIIDIPSGNIKALINLASNTQKCVDVMITPDGNTALLPTTSHLYIIDIPSGNVRELINLASDTNLEVDLRITPDGNAALLPTTSHLYIIDVSSGNIGALLNLASNTMPGVDIVITPEGNTAFLPTTSHLYMIDASSGNIGALLNLASNTMPGVDIVVTPEGNTALLPTTSHLYMIDVSSGNIKTLLNLASDTMKGVDIVVTPEGNTAFLPTTSHLYMIDVSSGNIKTLLNLASDTNLDIDLEIVCPIIPSLPGSIAILPTKSHLYIIDDLPQDNVILPTTSHLYMLNVQSCNIKELLNLASDTMRGVDVVIARNILTADPDEDFPVLPATTQTLPPTPTPTPTPTEKIIIRIGDANEDGEINADDITYVEQIINGEKPETELADANQDGKIDALDIAYIDGIILGEKLPDGTLSAKLSVPSVALEDDFTVSGTAKGQTEVTILCVPPKGGGGKSLLDKGQKGLSPRKASVSTTDDTFSKKMTVQEDATAGYYDIYVLCSRMDGVWGMTGQKDLEEALNQKFHISSLTCEEGSAICTKTQEEIDNILEDLVTTEGSDDQMVKMRLKVETAYVKLDLVAAVDAGAPLVVKGTSNRQEGYVIVVTCKGRLVELAPHTVKVENGSFGCVFDTTEAITGEYIVKADDGDGHTDEVEVFITGKGAQEIETEVEEV